MINVAWQVANTEMWIGGLNYFRNLLEALLSLPARKVDPVLLGDSRNLPPPFKACRSLPFPLKAGWTLGKAARWLSKWERRYFDNGGSLARHLRRNGIRLLSHGQILGRSSPVPTLCWIPDFQHRHLPDFFSKQELSRRDEGFRDTITRSQALLFSSENARRDCNLFLPGFDHKAHVLHFVAAVSTVDLSRSGAVLAKYGIDRPFFHVPNQLWAHKNHGIIRDALKILRDRGECPLVISTGFTDDYRNPGYFPAFRDSVRDARLDGSFRFLGLIPYGEVQVLLRASLAVINPSLFDGWSSTVEEGKSLGKRILLSDIPVHREQAPDGGLYFDPRNPEELAALISSLSAEYDAHEEELAALLAAERLPARLREFARRYEDIVARVAVHG